MNYRIIESTNHRITESPNQRINELLTNQRISNKRELNNPINKINWLVVI